MTSETKGFYIICLVLSGSRMKICIIGDATSVHVVKWVSWFSKNHEVHLISDKEAEIPNVAFHSVGSKNGMIALVKKGLNARIIVNEIRPEIVHAHFALGYGTIGAMCGRSPFIISTWGSDITVDSADMIKREVLKYTLRRADFISAYDSVLVERLGKLGFHKVLRKRIVGIDLKQFNPSRQHGLIPGMTVRPELTLICTRPLTTRGGVDTLIRALPIIKKQIPGAKALLIYLDGNDKSKMEALAESLNIRNDVVFLGRVAHDSMPDMLAASDIFIDTCTPIPEIQSVDSVDKCPGLGAAAMEAMAVGLPVIIPKRMNTDVGCPYVTYANGNADSLANAVIDLLDETARREIVARALTYVRETVSEDEIMADWERLYESLSARTAGLSSKSA